MLIEPPLWRSSIHVPLPMASLHHENSFIDPVFDAATAVHVSTMLFEGGESITEIVLGVMDTVILAAGFERK